MERKKCDSRLAHDVDNLAGMIAGLASARVHIPAEDGSVPRDGGVPRDANKSKSGWKQSGFWLQGPADGDRHIEYEFRCYRRQAAEEFGHGTCSSITISRRGPGASALKPTASVGNLHGLGRQLSRDMARLYGCAPEPTHGFEGARRRRGR